MTSRARGDIEEIDLPLLVGHLEGDHALSIYRPSATTLSIAVAGAEGRIEQASTAAALFVVNMSGEGHEQTLLLVTRLHSALTALRVRHWLELSGAPVRLHYLWPEPPGRLFQDDAFIVSSIEGAEVSSLFALVHAEPADDRVIQLFLMPTNGSWQHIFLDVGLAFWEDWGFRTQLPPAELDDEVRLLDLAARYHLTGNLVRRAWSEGDLANGNLASMTLLFNDGRQLVLYFDDPSNCESDVRVLVSDGSPGDRR